MLRRALLFSAIFGLAISSPIFGQQTDEPQGCWEAYQMKWFSVGTEVSVDISEPKPVADGEYYMILSRAGVIVDSYRMYIFVEDSNVVSSETPPVERRLIDPCQESTVSLYDIVEVERAFVIQFNNNEMATFTEFDYGLRLLDSALDNQRFEEADTLLECIYWRASEGHWKREIDDSLYGAEFLYNMAKENALKYCP